MSSLAASRADGYYFPPDYDPARHGSLNQFRGQHPLRERASKLDQGILVIRFEMPFNVWCGGCNHLIGKGVRFNAEKKQIGSYYSTKIWSFTMRAPCCSQKIEVQTDPQHTEYVVVSGGTRKAETWTAESAETMELPDKDEEAAAAPLDDPFSKLERGETDKRKGRELGARVAELFHDSNEKYKDDYSINKALRRNNRALRKQEKEREVRRKSLGLSDDIKLLPEAPEDSFAASQVQFGDLAAFTKKWQQKRRAIKAQSIFASSAAVKPAAARQNSIDGQTTNPAAQGESLPASGANEHSRRGTKRPSLSSSGTQHQAKRRHMGLDPIVEEAEEAEEQADGTLPFAEARPDQSRQAERPAKRQAAKRQESSEGRAQQGVHSSCVPAGAKLRTAVSRLLSGSLSGVQQKRKRSVAEMAAAAAKRQRGH